MGIHNLLIFLKPATKPVNLRHLRGQTCVIDIMGWLYRGAFGQAVETDSTYQGLRFLCYPFRLIKLLIDYGIKPILVFDGRPHEGKVKCEKKRAEDKVKAKQHAKELEKQGDKK
jgi:exonuclease-1